MPAVVKSELFAERMIPSLPFCLCDPYVYRMTSTLPFSRKVTCPFPTNTIILFGNTASPSRYTCTLLKISLKRPGKFPRSSALHYCVDCVVSNLYNMAIDPHRGGRTRKCKQHRHIATKQSRYLVLRSIRAIIS
jgi:hypothetical protein